MHSKAQHPATPLSEVLTPAHYVLMVISAGVGVVFFVFTAILVYRHEWRKRQEEEIILKGKLQERRHNVIGVPKRLGLRPEDVEAPHGLKRTVSLRSNYSEMLGYHDASPRSNAIDSKENEVFFSSNHIDYNGSCDASSTPSSNHIDAMGSHDSRISQSTNHINGYRRGSSVSNQEEDIAFPRDSITSKHSDQGTFKRNRSPRHFDINPPRSPRLVDTTPQSSPRHVDANPPRSPRHVDTNPPRSPRPIEKAPPGWPRHVETSSSKQSTREFEMKNKTMTTKRASEASETRIRPSSPTASIATISEESEQAMEAEAGQRCETSFDKTVRPILPKLMISFTQ